MNEKAVEPKRNPKKTQTGKFTTREASKAKGVNAKAARLISKKAVVTVRDAKTGQLSRNTLSNMAKKGQLVRLKPGVYENTNREPSKHESLVDVSAIAPKGIITLLSALQFHDLTTENPRKVWVAFPRGHRVPTIKYPPIRHFIVSENAYEYGVEKHKIQGVTVRVYSVAKTVADCFKYRNKIGFEIAKNALREAINDNKTTRDEIWKAAKVCRVQNIIRPYMESME